MAAFHNSVTIGRPAEEVFAFLAGLQDVPRWNHAIERTRKTPNGAAGEGTTGRQPCTFADRSVERLEVAIFEPPSRLAVRGRIGPFHATIGYLLKPTADGTQLASNIELKPAAALPQPVGPLAILRVKAAVARNLAVLKDLLEGAHCPANGNDQD
jgi:hypothetical protein